MLRYLKLGLLATLLMASGAYAQQHAPTPAGQYWLDTTATPPTWRAASSAYPVPVAATASIAGFAPSLSYGTLTATASSSGSTALPTNMGTVTLFNSGTTTVSCTFASGSATALASQNLIAANSVQAFYVTYGATTYDHVACIDQAGSASNVVVLSGGTGLATGWGGGGGGGSGGAVTAVSGAFVDGAIATIGTEADAAWSSGSGTVIALLKNAAAGIAAPVPGYYATAYNTCSQVTTTVAPICVDLNGNMYANISRYMGTAGTANASVMSVQGIASMTPFLTTTTLNAETTKVIGTVNQGTSPWVVSGAVTNAGTFAVQAPITSWAGGTLGSMANYGTSPGAVLVPGVNSFATNLPTVAVSVAPVTATNPAVVVDLRPDSPGIIALGQATKANSVPVTFASDQDPCSYAKKSSVPINITSATTTSLVAVSGSTAVYVCGFSVTINQEVTTADTILFEYGTGASCTGTTALTGLFGAGGVSVGIPVPISYGDGLGTVFGAPASNGICAVTAGTTPSFQGVLTYVQQ